MCANRRFQRGNSRCAGEKTRHCAWLETTISPFKSKLSQGRAAKYQESIKVQPLRARQRAGMFNIACFTYSSADYLVTAAISALDAFHYLKLPLPALWAVASILLIGVINFFGPRKAGTLALIIALATIGLTLVLASAAFSSLPSAHIDPPAGN